MPSILRPTKSDVLGEKCPLRDTDLFLERVKVEGERKKMTYRGKWS